MRSERFFLHRDLSPPSLPPYSESGLKSKIVEDRVSPSLEWIDLKADPYLASFVGNKVLAPIEAAPLAIFFSTETSSDFSHRVAQLNIAYNAVASDPLSPKLIRYLQPASTPKENLFPEPKREDEFIRRIRLNSLFGNQPSSAFVRLPFVSCDGSFMAKDLGNVIVFGKYKGASMRSADEALRRVLGRANLHLLNPFPELPFRKPPMAMV